MNTKYAIKVKNILGKDKEITLLNGNKYTLKDKDEKIIGFYSDNAKTIIFNLLKCGFEVSKILEENIQEHMKIDTIVESPKTVSSDTLETNNKSNNETDEKPKKRRGRPRKNKE